MINISPSSQITKIYLVTNCYGDPNKVYIGKTKNNTRKYFHQETYGKDIIFTYIDEVDSLHKQDWKPLESFWINYFKFLGFNIQNKNDGGSGPSQLSDITKKKISQAKKGYITSNETKLKISNSNKGKSKNNGFNISNNKTRGNNIKISNEIHYKLGSDRNKKISNILLGKKKSEKWLKSRYKPISQYNLNGDFIKSYNSATEASKLLNLNKSSITQCCKGKYKQSGGFKWKYKL